MALANDSSGKAWFKHKKMVRWFSPLQLLRTALELVLSGVFAKFSDKREIQAGIPADEHYDDDQDEDVVWVDFVADLGDGFDTTFSIANTLTKDRLALREGPDVEHVVDKGRILIMGGDQVYPTASEKQYRNRLIGPYRAAYDPPYESLPPADVEKAAPRLFAIPGNHDWYDGLTNFMRVFCQQGWIGGWRTMQSRSYFAMKLPGNWWIWGVDIQFDAYIDGPQVNFFRKVATEVGEDDAIVLCTAKPSWIDKDPESYTNLFFFQKQVQQARQRLGKPPAPIKVIIAGDKHHYARYSYGPGQDEATGDQTTSPGAEHLITAGGGGAYLSATHHLPGALTIPPGGIDGPSGAPPRPYSLTRCYPSRDGSKRYRWSALLFPLLNWHFVAFMAMVHLLFAWSLEGDLPWGEDSGFWRAMWLAPLLLAFTVVALWYGFATRAGWRRALMIGGTHGVFQAALMVFVGLLFHRVVQELGQVEQGIAPTGWDLLQAAALPSLAVLALGALASSFLLGAYLMFADLAKVNTNELFSSQRIEKYKNFLRLRFAKDGTLTIYPIGIDEPVRWRRKAGDNPRRPRFEPKDGKEPSPRLIDEVIVVNNPQPGSSGVESGPNQSGVLKWPH